ncbi:helix-turn-helix domain-containing protein [Castellaniella sp.]|uniref:helix-turn-helix transcriptional regulator n=1 Tax=Castellaniella sp. TaxID=1955812 RepID=UPI002AFE4DA5|nr:helix-turn-helix domain-containing protein [Castellaniella sp.]
MQNFKPITKLEAATILGVCSKSITNYINQGLLPKPVSIGRKAFWHPNVFYGHLHTYLISQEVTQMPHVKAHDEQTGPSAPLQPTTLQTKYQDIASDKGLSKSPEPLGSNATKKQPQMKLSPAARSRRSQAKQLALIAEG